ncbi:MAG: hypothetical protein K8S16_05090, partial [Bacteroidales bacterium]|nr:hypothetical protein [Bacteroidales bacterium]
MIKFVYFLLFGFFLISCNSSGPDAQKKNTESVTDPLIAQLDELNNQIRNDSLNPDLFQARSEFYLANQNLNSALKDILSALEIDSTYGAYYVTLSDVYLALGKLQKTVESLEKAIELDSGHIEAYLKLAEISIV